MFAFSVRNVGSQDGPGTKIGFLIWLKQEKFFIVIDNVRVRDWGGWWQNKETIATQVKKASRLQLGPGSCNLVLERTLSRNVTRTELVNLPSSQDPSLE